MNKTDGYFRVPGADPLSVILTIEEQYVEEITNLAFAWFSCYLSELIKN